MLDYRLRSFSNYNQLLYPSKKADSAAGEEYKAETKAKQTVVVSIDKNNQLYIGQKKINFSELEPELKSILQRETDRPSVVVNADTSGHWGDVYRILQTAKRLGATAVATVDAN